MGRSGRAGALLNPGLETLLVYLYFLYVLKKLAASSAHGAIPSPLQLKLLLLFAQSLRKSHLEGCGNLFGWAGGSVLQKQIVINLLKPNISLTQLHAKTRTRVLRQLVPLRNSKVGIEDMFWYSYWWLMGSQSSFAIWLKSDVRLWKDRIRKVLRNTQTCLGSIKSWCGWAVRIYLLFLNLEHRMWY